jgi:hypothetical protein
VFDVVRGDEGGILQEEKLIQAEVWGWRTVEKG